MNIYKILLNRRIIFLACTYFLLSCSNEAQKNLDKGEVIDVMTELMTIEHLAVSDSLKAVKIFKIMQTYNIKIDSLKNMIERYEGDPEYWHSVYNSIKNKINEKQTRNTPTP